MKKIGLAALALMMVVGLGAFGYNAIQSSRTASVASGMDSCCAAEEAALANASACPITQTATDDCCDITSGDESQTTEGETKVAVSETQE